MNFVDLLDYLRQARLRTAPVCVRRTGRRRQAFDPGVSRDDRAPGFQDRFEAFRDAPVLILDDVGAHAPTLWVEEKLYALLNHRTESQLTNRLIARVMGNTAPDYRQQGEWVDESAWGS